MVKSKCIVISGFVVSLLFSLMCRIVLKVQFLLQNREQDPLEIAQQDLLY